MGQGAAKPRIRMVLPADEQDGQIVEPEEDEEENNVDKLGVSAEESDYPEPRPPDKLSVVKEDRSQTGNTSEKLGHTNIVSRIQEEEIFSTKSKLEEEYQVELVPVGASFQKSIKKRAEINAELVGFPDDGTRSYPVVKTITRSISLRESLLGSSLMNSSGLLLGMTKREAMLAERERYEYMKLMAPVTETSTHRQFRRYNYDAKLRDRHTSTMNNSRNVEDHLANEIAEKHRDHTAETYTSLIKDLTSDVNSERLKVKVILAWMSKQGIGRLQFGPKPPPPDTPNGYMMLMQEGQGTFPVFFTLLCRAANLKCAIISGISKGSHYEVGSKDTELLRNTWNAVYVEGSWQLVHPLWVCKGVANRQLGGWVKIEEEGKAKRKLSIASTGKDVPSFNPYFIFTKPEEFIYRNFPDEGRWQLLPNPITLEHFLEQTYIRPIFFINNFKLQSVDACMHESETGDPCEITIAFPKQSTSDVVFGYELSMKTNEQTDELHLNNGVSDQNTEETGEDVTETERYVMVKKSESSVTFEVRFFKTGTYKLRLYGGYFKEFGNKPPWIIDALLKCENILPQADPLPFDPGPVGWGPGPISENVGLYVPSHVESEVLVTEEEDTIIYFILQNKIKVNAALHHCILESNELQKFVEISTVEIGDILTLQIRLMYPGKGEFGLKINVKNHQMDVNACNYILHTGQKRPFESFYPRRARRILLNAMETCDLDFVKGALEECKRTGLPDTDPDVMGARNRFEFLSCKTELYVALLVNRIDVSEHALYRTRKANLDILLVKEVLKVEEHLQKLQKLDEGGWTCEIPEIDRQSLVELSQLRKPKLEVQLVITTMYMLLGIEEENLKDWGKVRKFLRNQQSTLVEVARLEKYLMLDTTDGVTVSESVLDRVQEKLTNYTLEHIRRVDNTAAAYFQWVISITEKLKENQKKIESSRLAKASATKSTASVVTKVPGQISSQHARQTSLSITTISLKSKTTTTQKSLKENKSLEKSNMTLNSSAVSKRPSVITQKTVNKSHFTNDQKADSIATKQTLPLNTSGDVPNLDPISKKKSGITLNSKNEKSQSFISATQSFRKVGSGSEEQSNTSHVKDKSVKSFVQESVSRKGITSQQSSTLQSRLSPGSEGVPRHGSVVSNRSSKSKSSQALVRPKPMLNSSSTFTHSSLKGEKHVSRTESNVTHKSVKSLSKALKSRGSERISADASLNNGTKNGNVQDLPLKSKGLSGRTFFSDSGGSQREQTSRPVSKKVKIKCQENQINIML
ncbi:uncharacterized protein LOC123566288 [Mercenaria mercenaria]|uniref:uncharacterized protein LOC123566288 n=1 Tax=Mercenaria mercenaria TaxID=6596 RepID=UPI00234FAA96|nr:uncharacterized protein LOC123566288 [Mercenaria mercenaria]XP_053406032.1 uncharacterized protein LOC123566288 [Mercenaria mercenaria]